MDAAGPSAATSPAPRTANCGTASTATAGAGPSSPSPELLTAVQLAVASSCLTYPYTLAHTLSVNASLADVVARVGGAGQVLTVLVLGASQDAELAHLPAWKVRWGTSIYAAPMIGVL